MPNQVILLVTYVTFQNFTGTMLTEIITDRRIIWRINVLLQIQIPGF